MDYRIDDTAAAIEAHLSGRFTFADVGPFKQIVARIKEARSRRFILDLRGIEFIDSAAMGMLLMARDTAAAERVDLALRAPEGQVKRILDVAKFDTLFTIV